MGRPQEDLEYFYAGEFFRGSVTWGMQGHFLQSKRKIIISCVSHHKEECNALQTSLGFKCSAFHTGESCSAQWQTDMYSNDLRRSWSQRLRPLRDWGVGLPKR